MGSTKKKMTSTNRRLRDRSRLSFFFVIFFFGLFSVIIIMENFMPDTDKNSLKDDNEDGEEPYTNSDISYEETLDQEGLLPSGNTDPKAKGSKNSSNNGHTASTQKPRIIPIQPDWQPVTGTKEKFYVYSAYYNHLFDHVKIIGATRTKTQQRVKCRFYDNDTRVYHTVDGTVRTIRENWNLKYSACFIICYSGDKKRRPRYVSILPSTASTTTPASNILRIQYASEKSDRLVDFSVCVKPIHFNYDNLLPLLEWIEFHRLMGVEHFTFYNSTIGPKVSCLIEHYGEEIIEILPWTLPFVSQKEIRTEGLFVALNDCVYRHRGASKYLILVDFDEMIVPRKTHNYTQLIDQLDTLSNKKKIGAYSIQNAFFYLQWPDDQKGFTIPGNPLAEQVTKHLLSLRKTRRRARLHPHKQRSKYICDPEKVVEAGNHFVWEMATGYYTLSVPPHLAALHHYRVCEFGGDQCTKNPSVIDKSSHIFAQALAIRVAEKLQQLSTKCHIDISQLFYSKPSSRSVV
ncbi:unnamed protein product [Allacma fusca]|uniref:Glycosyltransferase family 92 protein n=1 Tax=Allacma fusca TaxID=39272 RepID=A0A8J2M7U7_9HEXA|nr:unnamed protein product [Allacma fusca]